MLKCWRRFALIIGTAVSRYSFSSIVKTVENLLGEGVDVFEGLVEAAKPCDIDDFYLVDNELRPSSRRLLTTRRGIPMGVYLPIWMDIAKELEGEE